MDGVRHAQLIGVVVDGLQVFEDLFESLPDSVTLSVAVRDASGRAIDMRLLRMNGAARTSQSDPDASIGGLCSEMWPQMVLNGSFDACMRVLDSGDAESGAFWWTQQQSYRSAGYDYRAARVGTELLLWVLRDNNDQVQVLRHDEARFQAAFHDAPAGMAIVTGAGQIVLANPALAALLADDDGERLVGTSLASWIVPEDRQLVGTTLDAVGADSETVGTCRLRVTNDGSSTVWAQLSVTPLTVQDDWSNCFIIHASDITSQKTLEADAGRGALRDQLTDLPNHALVLDRLQMALHRLDRHRSAVGIVVVDLDRFEDVEHAGSSTTRDLVRIEVARELVRHTRVGDTVGRFGDDRFVVICEDLDDGSELHGLATRIGDAFRRPLLIGDQFRSVTVALGLASSTDQHAVPNELIRLAGTTPVAAATSDDSLLSRHNR